MRAAYTPLALAFALALALVLLAGCGPGVQVGSEEGGLRPDPGPAPYAGPLDVVPQRHGGVLRRGGSAARALECDGRPTQAGGADYDSGLATTASSGPAALRVLLRADRIGSVPASGYRVERADPHRLLLSYDVAGRTRVAFVAADDVRDWRGRTGWGVVSWAACDVSELPPAEAAALGVGVWIRADGARVPTTRVTSFAGAEHCDWQSATFLELDGDRRWFVRDPRGVLGDLVDTGYDAAASLPADARATGLRRAGRELWVAADRSAAYLVDVADPASVERWPALRRPIGCA